MANDHAKEAASHPWRRRRPCPARAFWLAVVAFAAIACSRGQRQAAGPVGPSLTKPRPGEGTAPPKHGIELYAEAQGNVVFVTLKNHTAKEFWVGPKMFGLIIGRQVYTVGSADVVARFPIRRVRSGEGASGSFQFRSLAALVGARVVFNSPEAGQLYTIIQAYETPKPNFQPQLKPLTAREQRRLKLDEERLRQELEKTLKQQGQPPVR